MFKAGSEKGSKNKYYAGQLETPVAFMIFNRPDCTRKVFAEIRKARPKKLFIVADGPRTPSEAPLCEETRAVVEHIDWPCEVRKNYAERNLGLKERFSSGLNWFFENVERGIILEDDCLPNKSFFWFCEELLEKYKNDNKIAMISGNNFQDGLQRGCASYYFSLYGHVWGWATWKRAWKYYDVEMKDYPSFKKEKRINSFWENPVVREYWINIFDKVYKNKIDTWDYQWVYAMWKRDGMSIIPNANLVKNIGFGPNATHTKTEETGQKMVLETSELNILKHPESITQNKEADDYATNRFGINKPVQKNMVIKTFLKKIWLASPQGIYAKIKKLINNHEL